MSAAQSSSGEARYVLAPNLTYAFPGAGPGMGDRVRAAAAAGFDHVEIIWLEQDQIADLTAALQETGVRLWNLATIPTFALVKPETHEDFLPYFRGMVDHAAALGSPHIVVPSGIAVPYLTRPAQLDIFTDVISRAAEIARAHGITILLEAANTRLDHPGILLSMTEDAAYVVRTLHERGVTNVRVQYDVYHSLLEREDPWQVLPDVIDITAHVQIGDLPGRPEPGKGTVDWERFFDLLDSVGYRGVIGMECHPTLPGAEAFDYVRDLLVRRGSLAPAPSRDDAPTSASSNEREQL